MRAPETIDFSDLGLQLGQPLEMLVDLNQKGSICLCEVIGYLAGESLIIGPPRDSGALPLLEEGQRVAIRVKTPSGIACFQTTILFIAEIPTLMVYLDHPPKIKFRELRGAARATVSLPVLVDNLTDTQFSTIAGRIVDISKTGARLEMCDAMGAKNQLVKIKCKILIGDIERRLEIKAKVISQASRSSGYIYGVEFCDAEEEMLLILLAYVYQVMALGQLQTVY